MNIFVFWWGGRGRHGGARAVEKYYLCIMRCSRISRYILAHRINEKKNLLVGGAGVDTAGQERLRNITSGEMQQGFQIHTCASFK